MLSADEQTDPPSGSLEPQAPWADEIPKLEELPLTTLQPEGASPSAGADLRSMGLLGEGGMSHVWLARQRSLARKVAVKTARVGVDGEDRGAPLVREALITGMLEHPNIPPIHALGRDPNGRPVLVMTNIEGVSWARVLDEPDHPLREQSPLFAGLDALPANLEVLAQVCNALELAHAHEIIHRDVKPANVMLGRFGEVYLIDWGVAFNRAWHREGEPVDLCGTASYVAPEMVTGELPDPRTDVYLLGATLHELLTGSPPHSAATLSEKLAQAFESAPHEYPPSVPPELAALCRRAMARSRDERPATVREFRNSLRRHLSHRSSIALCAEADRRAVELRATLEAREPSVEALSRLQNECRFGYQQALREWPDNAAAREGLSTVLRALCEHAIAVEDVRGARALLAEHGANPALESKVVALEAALAARDELARRAREAADAMDVQRAARERSLVLGAMLLMAAGVLLWRRLSPVDALDPRARSVSLLVVWIAVALTLGTIVAILWRRLSTSTVNRRIVTLTMAMILAVLAHRLTGLALLTPAYNAMAGDLAVAMMTALAMGAFVARGMLWMTLPSIAGMIATCLVPTRAGLWFNASMLVFVLVAAWQLRGSSRAPHDERAPNER
ncbi:MAG: bifunctional serine/threonine protein kinase/MFS transporter [Polyangiales bacterium]